MTPLGNQYVWKVPLTEGGKILLTEKKSEGYWGPGIFFTTGNHCQWSFTPRAAYWDDYSPGQLLLIDLPHCGPVPLTLRETLHKYLWKPQDDQEELYKINHLDFTSLLTLVHLGPGSLIFVLFSFPVLLLITLVSLEPGSSLLFSRC